MSALESHSGRFCDGALISFSSDDFARSKDCEFLPEDLENAKHPHLAKHVINNLHLEDRLNVVRADGRKVRYQKLPYCHLCGRQFGTASLVPHYKACARKLKTAISQLPRSRRFAIPGPPDAKAFPAPRKQSDPDAVYEAYNKEALRIFGMLTEAQLEERVRRRRQSAAGLIQRMYRGYRARHAITERAERRRKTRERAAAGCIQRAWKDSRRRRETRERAAAVRIQRAWRRTLQRRTRSAFSFGGASFGASLALGG